MKMENNSTEKKKTTTTTISQKTHAETHTDTQTHAEDTTSNTRAGSNASFLTILLVRQGTCKIEKSFVILFILKFGKKIKSECLFSVNLQ